MGSFYTDVISRDPRFSALSGVEAAIRDMALLEPGFRAKVEALIADAANEGITLVVTETFRSAPRQQYLFAQHKTQLDGKTPASIGVHHFGLAVDVMRVESGKADWSTEDYLFLEALCAKHDLVWGGDWGVASKLHQPGFHDWDHIQGCTVAEQHALFAGTWYPESPAV